VFLHTYTPEKIFLDLGFATIHWYGLVLCLAVASGFLVAQKLNRQQKILNQDKLLDLFLWIVIFALLGGRLVHVLTFLNYYLENPAEILALWHGGIAFYGVFLGGLVALVYVSVTSPHPLLIKEGSLEHHALPLTKGEIKRGLCIKNILFINTPPPSPLLIKEGSLEHHALPLTKGEKKRGLCIKNILFINTPPPSPLLIKEGSLKTPTLTTDKTGSLEPQALPLTKGEKKRGLLFLCLLDLVAPAVAIGQAIGRWGNWFNQELFGTPTTLAWGIPIDFINRPLGFENFQYFHPLFLYESLAMLAVFFLLLYFFKQPWSAKAPGFIFGFYLICHGSLRFVLEFLRLDIQPLIFGLRLFQIVAGLEIIAGLVLLVLIKKWYNKIYE